MTSPCVGRLDLLGHDDLDAVVLRLRPGLQRAGDDVVVGDGDRPEALVARGGQQHLDRRGAVGRVVGVHVQVDVDEAPGGHAPAQRRVAAGGMPPGGHRRVDALELVGHAVPGQHAPQRLGAGAQARAQVGVGEQPRELAPRTRRGRRGRTAGRGRPRRAPPRRRRGSTPAGRPPPRSHAGPGRARARRRRSASTQTSAVASASASPPSTNATRARSSSRSGIEDDAPRSVTTVAPPGDVGPQAAQRAQEQAQRAALLVVDERRPARARVARPRRAPARRHRAARPRSPRGSGGP